MRNNTVVTAGHVMKTGHDNILTQTVTSVLAPTNNDRRTSYRQAAIWPLFGIYVKVSMKCERLFDQFAARPEIVGDTGTTSTHSLGKKDESWRRHFSRL
ncbi:hypothetical protein [Alloyangia pacifica]|uniref:hypothetical protein n=1 Tax=Alloyangia pacifica TaxID=311180 RepID=UPI001CFDE57E|nr:hypothetical protein [Alloyangia pacifica]